MTALNIARDAEQNCEEICFTFNRFYWNRLALASFHAVAQTHELDLLFRCKPIEAHFYYENRTANFSMYESLSQGAYASLSII